MASELTNNTSGNFEPVEDDGGWFGRSFYKLRKTGEKPTTTQGATGNISVGAPETNDNMIIEPKTNGKNLNTEGAEYAAAMQGGGGTNNISTGGNVTSTTQNSVTQTYIADETMTGDRGMKDAILT